MYTPSLASSWLLLASIGTGYASQLATFSDASCAASLETVDGVQGYPDGVCTKLSEAAGASFSGFMFTKLDTDCIPTIYQTNDGASCGGYAFEAELAVCYNTSWEWYSIDNCERVQSTGTGRPAATSLSPLPSAAVSTPSSTISGGQIAGAVVGSVCGLGIIVALSAWVFWFHPNEKRKALREKIENDRTAGAATGTPDGDEAQRLKVYEMSQADQLPLELSSPTNTADRSTPSAPAVAAEVPGGSVMELREEESYAAELPGDREHQSSESTRSYR